MKLRLSLRYAAIAVGYLVAAQISAHAQVITSFDPPGSTETIPLSINPAGEITGWYFPFGGHQDHGFVRGR